MKVITEAILRDELRATQPEVYVIPEGKILSPAAREYLQQRKIKIAGGPGCVRGAAPSPAKVDAGPDAKYVDYETGVGYAQKPEHMTQLAGNKLVAKDHPRILFRGKLDSLQAQVVLAQADIYERNVSYLLVTELSEILGVLREMMRCDVLEEPFVNETILGLSHDEIRDRSHHPQKYFSIQQMLLPDYTMGKTYALLNSLRTAVRECEVACTHAFCVKGEYTRSDIVEGLNRMSSILHIMMCRFLAGEYK